MWVTQLVVTEAHETWSVTTRRLASRSPNGSHAPGLVRHHEAARLSLS
jgi:hypothetical protein